MSRRTRRPAFSHRAICDCFLGPAERRTFWLSNLKEGSSHEVLCLNAPLNGNGSRQCRRSRWRRIRTECVESTPAANATALKRCGPAHRVVIETGRMTPSVALGLRELGVPIDCIDARRACQSLESMKANKTDLYDAADLAQFARTGYSKEVHVSSPAAHDVRSVITARGHLVEARVRLDNTIRGLCATCAIRLGVGQGARCLARRRRWLLSRGFTKRSHHCSACTSV